MITFWLAMIFLAVFCPRLIWAVLHLAALPFIFVGAFFYFLIQNIRGKKA